MTPSSRTIAACLWHAPVRGAAVGGICSSGQRRGTTRAEMPVVYLVRHGQASFGAENYDVLSPTGLHQSTRIGEELARRSLRRPLSLSGSLQRQRDTARVAMAAGGIPGVPEVDPRLDEYDHLGLIERYRPGGNTEHDGTSRGLQRSLDAALLQWIADDAGGWRDFHLGARDALSDLVGRLLPGQDAVVFTSGGVIAALCAGLLGLGAPGVVALNRVTVNGSLHKLVAGASGTTLISFNDHAHLEGSDPSYVTYR
jgi:broad specificity phosphatase PhoE